MNKIIVIAIGSVVISVVTAWIYTESRGQGEFSRISVNDSSRVEEQDHELLALNGKIGELETEITRLENTTSALLSENAVLQDQLLLLESRSNTHTPTPALPHLIPESAASEKGSNFKNEVEQLLGRSVDHDRLQKALLELASRRAELEALLSELEATYAAEFADKLSTEYSMSEAFQGKNPMEYLSLLSEASASSNVVSDPLLFDELFTRKLRGQTIDGGKIDNFDNVGDGAHLSYTSGVHKLSFPEDDLPADILVTGSGMDNTLLQLEELGVRSEVKNLTFEDMTIDCANNYLTDLRHEKPVTIKLIRCRVVRFDMGAGGSVMLSTRYGTAFYAVDSIFAAGYGRSPGSGSLFRQIAGCPLLVRMDRCRIEGLFRGIVWGEPEPDKVGQIGAYHFEECVFVNAHKQFDDLYQNGHEQVTFSGCAVENVIDHAMPGYKEAYDKATKQRLLSEINLMWDVE